MPASNPQISVRISSKADEFQAGLAQVRKDLADLPKLAEQVSRDMGRSSARFGGFDIGRQISRATTAARGGLGPGFGGIGAVSRMVPGVGGLVGAASIAGVGELVSRYASAGVELRNTARLAGTSMAGLNSLRGAARMVGLTAGDADQAMLGLNHALADATYGRNPEAARTFQQFGISFGDMAHGARSAEQVLPQIVDTLTELAQKSPLAAERLAAMWGVPSSALPMMIRGRQALEANRREITSLYGGMGRYAAMSDRFTEAQGRLTTSSERLGMVVATAAEPALTRMMNGISGFIHDHEREIDAGLNRMITYFGRVAEVAQMPGRRYNEWALETQGTPQQQVDRYGDAYRRVMPPGADNRSAWQRIAPYWAGGTDAPTSRMRPTQRPPGQLPSGPLGGWENGVPPSDDRNAPRGIRNNNPLNLEYRGQQGSIGTDGRFGRYGDMRDGVGAGLRQLLMYQERDGLQTVAAMINRWAPPSENDTNSYARRVASAMGVDPNTAVNLRDPEAAARMVTAMSQVENGRAVDPRLVRQGVNRVLGRPDDDGVAGAIPGSSRLAPTVPAFASQGNEGRQPTPTERFRFPMHDDPSTWPKPPSDNGSSTVRIEIDHSNVPAGVTMTPTVKGDGAEMGDIRVRRAMPQAGNTGPFNSFAGP